MANQKAYGKGHIEQKDKNKWSIELHGGKDPRTGIVYHLPCSDYLPGIEYTDDIPGNAYAVNRVVKTDSDGNPKKPVYRKISPQLRYENATDADRVENYWQTKAVYLRAYDTILGTKRQAEMRVEQMRVELDILSGIIERGIDPDDLKKYGLSVFKAREELMDARMLSEEYERLRTAEKGITFAEQCEDYLSTREKRGNKRTNTLKSDRVYSKHLLRAFGDMVITDIKPGTISKFYADMTAAGVGATTIKQCHGLLNRVMKSALYDEIINRNPVDKVEVPKVPKAKRNALSKAEANRLLGLVISGDPTAYKIAVLIGLSLGARIGEVLGIEWQHVVFDSEHPYIHLFQQHLGKGETGALKTDDDGNPVGRIVPIDAMTVRQMSEWKNAQRLMLNKLGIEQGDKTPVVSTGTGEYVNRSNLRKWFCSWCVDNGFARWLDDDGKEIVELVYGVDDAELYPGCVIEWRDLEGWPCDDSGKRFSRSYKRPEIKRHYDGLVFHELRHTHFTLLAQNGTPITVAMALGGWSTPRMLEDIYMHATPDAIWDQKGFCDEVLGNAAQQQKA